MRGGGAWSDGGRKESEGDDRHSHWASDKHYRSNWPRLPALTSGRPSLRWDYCRATYGPFIFVWRSAAGAPNFEGGVGGDFEYERAKFSPDWSSYASQFNPTAEVHSLLLVTY